uniref:Uncharacterized protein n=1 Tax=Anguilla anguilla TaxID=7936 RepID=A0A0E9SHD7_ANGAN
MWTIKSDHRLANVNRFNSHRWRSVKCQ